MPRYASAGVPELWIENLEENLLLVYRDPAGNSYQTRITLTATDSVSVHAFPTLLSVSGNCWVCEFLEITRLAPISDGRCDIEDTHHSLRSATIGSTRIARRAGGKQATNATARNSPAMPLTEMTSMPAIP